MIEVTQDQLLEWAAAACLADSYMSLIYHRGAIATWGDTPATPTSEAWTMAMGKARLAYAQMETILKRHGITDFDITQEMHRPPWAPRAQ